MVKKTRTDNVQSLTVPSVSPQTNLSQLPIEFTIALTFFFQDDRNGLGYKNSASKDRLWLLAVRMTTIAFPRTRLGRLSTMATAVVFSTFRDRLGGVYLALTSFVCTIFECHRCSCWLTRFIKLMVTNGTVPSWLPTPPFVRKLEYDPSPHRETFSLPIQIC